MSAYTNAIFKLAYRFALNGTPLVGYTVAVTMSGGNSPAHLFSENTGTLKFHDNKLVTDSDGNVSCFVRKGTYRLTLLSPTGVVMSVTDPVYTAMDGVTADIVSHPVVVDVAYAASITPVVSAAHTVLRVAALGGAITITDPAGTIANHAGKQLTILLVQDATGGRVATWGSSYSKAADAAGTANQRGATTYFCDGTKWLQVGGALTYR